MPELPPRYAFRLEDLRAWHLVEASCRRCRHRAPVHHQLLLRGRPLYTRLYDRTSATLPALRRPGGQASLAVRLRPRD